MPYDYQAYVDIRNDSAGKTVKYYQHDGCMFYCGIKNGQYIGGESHGNYNQGFDNNGEGHWVHGCCSEQFLGLNKASPIV